MNRVVDSLVILVVDALRFDFAYYNLPNSVGKRLGTKSSRLFQFVADPPTVTMQRLKALTTGGLPTFADISANFGGATLEEDSWVHQVHSSDWRARGLQFAPRMGFVGDDTWEDLFPGLFHESYPYPSFNTRDLDTVDNGCLSHIPGLLQHIHHRHHAKNTHDADQKPSDLEVMVVHFLGVDHVGHTYGPHNQHMDAKLRQMDEALSRVLDRLEEEEEDSAGCHATFIFGDHGMTPDGNHGGGTPEETNAALFVHATAACGNMLDGTLELEQTADSVLVQEANFYAIHQIDLVPTIAVLLGLPIPYANLGSFVPALTAGQDIRQVAAALALNAAQVWRYFTVYSQTANQLPGLQQLQDKLELATSVYKDALATNNDGVVDADAHQQASHLYKIFLHEALALGQRVWTRFDSLGMTGGILVLCSGLLLYVFQVWGYEGQQLLLAHFWELLAAAVFMFYQCGMLTFSNSYILEEKHSIMFSLSVLSAVLAFRLWSDPKPTTLWRVVLAIPIASRLNEALVSGHGLDPSIPLHIAHSRVFFVTSLVCLGYFRWKLFESRKLRSFAHCVADCLTLSCLAGSWWEKRIPDESLDGFRLAKIALALLFGGIPISIFQALTRNGDTFHQRKTSHMESDILTTLSKLWIATMAVTGPSTASSLVLYAIQASALYAVSSSADVRVHPAVLAALWKLITRHIFFATNHGCAFNRLQYSAAFVATREFYFVTGGISLFLNTFGWEMTGLVFAWLLSGKCKTIWRYYGVYQLVEALCSCLSVSLLRRHLMVWDIYAPHFLFSAIFSILNLLSQLTVIAMSD